MSPSQLPSLSCRNLRLLVRATAYYLMSVWLENRMSALVSVTKATWLLIHPASPIGDAGCIGPHVYATNVCLELMLQPLPRLIPFFGGPTLPHLSSSSLACQVFSWIPQLPSAALASECVLHPFLWHEEAIELIIGSNLLLLSVSDSWCWLFRGFNISVRYLGIFTSLLCVGAIIEIHRHWTFIVLGQLQTYSKYRGEYKHKKGECSKNWRVESLRKEDAFSICI